MYKKSAILAAKIASNNKKSPKVAWEQAAKKEFPSSKSNQQKGCPKNTFLGLCEISCIKGIPAGNYTRSDSNKLYGIVALIILAANQNQLYTPAKLWKEVLTQLKLDANKKPNSQMNVVLALWNEGYINI
jgi:hypothetical protein